MNKQTGVTLIELMVTVVVAVILATVAVPGFQEIFRENRVSSQVNELVTIMSFARSEAVRRGTDIRVVVTPNGSDGWSAVASVLDTGEQLRTNDRSDDRVELDGGQLTIDFNNRGYANASSQRHMQPSDSCRGDQRRLVDVHPSGRVSVSRVACN